MCPCRRAGRFAKIVGKGCMPLIELRSRGWSRRLDRASSSARTSPAVHAVRFLNGSDKALGLAVVAPGGRCALIAATRFATSHAALAAEAFEAALAGYGSSAIFRFIVAAFDQYSLLGGVRRR